MTNRFLRVWPALILMAVVSVPAFAQGTATSSITGVVVDADGGFVPGATVHRQERQHEARNSPPSAARTASFTVPAVNIGTYTVTVIAAGVQDGGAQGRDRHGRRPGDRSRDARGRRHRRRRSSSPARPRSCRRSRRRPPRRSTRSRSPACRSDRAARSTSRSSCRACRRRARSATRRSTACRRARSAITLDGVNIQDNTLKTTDGFFAIVSPRLDAIEEVTLTRAAQGAEASGQGGVQIKFTTRSGSNAFIGSGYHFYQSDELNTNTYANQRARAAEGPADAASAGHSPGRPGGDSRRCTTAAARCSSSSTSRQTRSPGTITTNSTLLLPDAQNGIFKYHGGPAGGVNLVCAGGGQRPHRDARSHRRQTAAGHPQLDVAAAACCPKSPAI